MSYGQAEFNFFTMEFLRLLEYTSNVVVAGPMNKAERYLKHIQIQKYWHNIIMNMSGSTCYYS